MPGCCSSFLLDKSIVFLNEEDLSNPALDIWAIFEDFKDSLLSFYLMAYCFRVLEIFSLNRIHIL